MPNKSNLREQVRAGIREGFEPLRKFVTMMKELTRHAEEVNQKLEAPKEEPDAVIQRDGKVIEFPLQKKD